jgi:hypothetical protein
MARRPRRHPELWRGGSNLMLLWPLLKEAPHPDLLYPGRKRYCPSLVIKTAASKVASKKPTRTEP